jgi:hypothetical protein
MVAGAIIGSGHERIFGWWWWSFAWSLLRGARIPTVVVDFGATLRGVAARERARGLELGSLVNAFTNCGDVKGEFGRT